MQIIQAPALEHDAMMASRFGAKVSPEGRLERRIVANLIAHLRKDGFRPDYVYDGGDHIRVTSAKAAMEVVFSVDEATLQFRKPGFSRHGVLLILGNGVDVISDWNYSLGDPDGFDAAMDAFDAERFA